MRDDDTLAVEVIYALPLTQDCVTLALPAGCRVREAIEGSGLLQRHPSIDLESCRLGVWGRRAKLDDALRDGDRVEIYRPLQVEPKEARRARAADRKV
jgi:hypothetical protein